ncbi:MAG TPA: TPM domain-containing protein [Pyrinomonadaceae bacterium]|nr:TPM domain-containing protein [Pyrinomonadaceae bacterium]
MKRKFLPSALFTTATLLFAALTGIAQWSQNTSPLPAPTGMVNDYAGVLDAATKQQVEQKLISFRDSTNPKVEIAVAVVKTTGDRDIFDYSLAVARGWGIGSKEDENPSALLFVAIDDRRYFTQVSKDLEDELPDGAVGSIQRQYLVPEFKKQNYGKGISDTVDAYIQTIRNKGNAPVAKTTPTPGDGTGGAGLVGSGFNMFCCAIILLIVLLVIFGSRRKGGPSKNDRDRWGGGPFGGGGGVSSALPWIVGGIISNIGSSSSSGSSDWGGSSGGGSDWGGFGGGGDFGGGGAGGDW